MKKQVNTQKQLHFKKLFSELAPRYAERNGGYTRILKTEHVVVMLRQWLSSNWYNIINFVECYDDGIHCYS